MEAVLRKAIADLRAFRLPSLLIFIIIAAAAVTLTLSLLIRKSADDPWNRAFAEANGPDVVYYAASDVDLSKVASIEGVTQVSDVFPTYGDSSLVRNDVKYDMALFGLGPTMPSVNRPLMMDGSWLSAGGGDQIVLEQSFARELGIKVGDRVSVATPNGVSDLTVAGLAVTLGRGPYPDWSTAVSWVLPETLARLAPDRSTWSNAISVKVADPENSTDYAAKVNALFPNQQDYGNDDWHEVKSAFNMWNQIASIFFGVFSVFALMAVAFIIANAIGGRVLAQFREIGLMKAIGYTPSQVTTVFLAQHLLLGLAGALAGIGLGTLLAPYFLDHTATLLGAPATASFDPMLSLEILIGVLLLVVIFTLLPAWRGSRVSVVEAVTTGFSPAQSRPSLPARLALRLRLPLIVSVGIKDAFSRPARAIFTIAALAMTVITVTFALGTEAMIEQLVNNPALNAEPYDMVVSRDGMSDDQTRAILAKHPEIVAQHSLGGVETRALHVPGADGPVSFVTRIFGGDYQAFPYAVGAGRMMTTPNEAVAGAGLLKLLHVQVGDDVTVTIDQKPVTFHLVGQVVENDDEGQILFIRDDAMRAIDPGYVPDTYLLLLARGTDAPALQRTLLTESNYALSVSVRSTDTPSEVTTMRTVLFGLSASLLVIGLANLLTTSLLNVRERSREVGVFKAIGMTPGQVLLSVISGVSLLALIAVGVGIPLGIYVYKEIFHVVGVEQLNADPLLYASPHVWWLVLLVPSAIAVAALASALPAWRAANVDVVEVLRAE
jgi:putative ABC transport system permease protein